MIRFLAAKLEQRARDAETKRLLAEADALIAARARLEGHDDAQLREAFARLRGAALTPDARVEALAIVGLAARRHARMTPRRGQDVAALRMVAGDVVELATGEGKTLAIAMAAIALTRVSDSVHVLTPNTYLATRDARLARVLAGFFRLEVGLVSRASKLVERRFAYAAPITYASAPDAVFDALRDARASRAPLPTIARFDAVIFDELDATLLDAARTPLVLSGARDEDEGDSALTRSFEAIVRRLRPDVDYVVDLDQREASFTDEGYVALETRLREADVLDADAHLEDDATLLGAAQAALTALALTRADHEYVVTERGRVVPVDRFTGRALPGRRFMDGLHEAIEAKEGLAPRGPAVATSATSYAAFSAKYRMLTGASGTLVGLEDELRATYGVEVAHVPRDVPSARVDEPDRVYTTDPARLAAVVEEVARASARAQPTFVIARSEQASRMIAHALRARGLAPRHLSAKLPREEVRIVAEAAVPGAITVTTLMAGRGTDIVLGGGDAAAADRVRASGGLLVIGVERHEARRIDAQIRGRAGRRGDPGRTVFFVSLEDDVVTRYAPPRTLERVRAAVRHDDGSRPEGYDALFEAIVDRAEGDARRARTMRFRFDRLRAREEAALATLRARLREGREDAPPGHPRLRRENVARRVDGVLALQAKRATRDGVLRTHADGVSPLGLRRAIALELGVELRAVPEAADREALVAALTTRVHAALEDRLAWALELAGPANEHAVLAIVRDGRPWRALRRFRDAYLEALDEGFRAHLEAMRTEEASLGLARLAHRQPELVYAERAHASFLAFVARAERLALEALLARDPAHDADVSAPT